MEKIKEFRGEWRFLSNFWPAEVTYNRRKFKTVENAYQAAKCVNVGDQQAIQMMSPGGAKRFGKVLGGMRRLDWNDKTKLAIMKDLLRQKFQDPELCQKLLATGDSLLEEGNYWHDTFWGRNPPILAPLLNLSRLFRLS